MAANDTLPNPNTPLAFLPPDDAAQFQAAIYIDIAILSVRMITPWVLSTHFSSQGIFVGLVDFTS
jgi:hypothetical protein